MKLKGFQIALSIIVVFRLSNIWCIASTEIETSAQKTTVEIPKLKILFVLNQFPKFIQHYILNQITGLIDRGHEVHIYANNRYTKHIPEEVNTYNLFERTYFRTLPSQIKDFDIIYCQSGPEGYCGIELKKLYNLSGTIVTCFRGDDLSVFIQHHPQKKQIKKRGPFMVPCYHPGMYHRLFKFGKLFLPVCDHFKKRLIKLGCKETKIKVGHSAIDCKKFAFTEHVLDPDKTIHLISVCRLVEKKGLHYAIQAVASLCKKYPTLHYTIIGDGNQKEKLQQEIDALGVSESITLTGWKRQEEILEFLQRSHIFLLPALTAKNGDEEGIPNAVKEAMACGLPIISTRHSGIPELVIDGVSGFLIDEKRIEPMAVKIEEFIHHPESVSTMGRAGRAYVEQHFDIDKELDKLEKRFYHLAKK